MGTQPGQKLQLFAEWIDKRDDSDADGYVSRSTTLNIWRRPCCGEGERTPAQEAVLAEGGAVGSRSRSKRKYDYAQIEKAADRVFADVEAGKWQGYDVSAVSGMRADYDGITVRHTHHPRLTAGRSNPQPRRARGPRPCPTPTASWRGCR